MAIVTAVALLATAAYGVPQTLPFQQDQNQLNRNAGARQIRNANQADGRITQRQAANLVRQRFPGNILRISLIGEDDKQSYQIRMENEGKVFTVFVHVLTGRISGGP